MDQNPIRAQGHRNVFCPYYNGCLDHAAKRYWESWSCLKCQHKQEQKAVTEVLLAPGSDYPYYTLSPSFYDKVENFTL